VFIGRAPGRGGGKEPKPCPHRRGKADEDRQRRDSIRGISFERPPGGGQTSFSTSTLPRTQTSGSFFPQSFVSYFPTTAKAECINGNRVGQKHRGDAGGGGSAYFRGRGTRGSPRSTIRRRGRGDSATVRGANPKAQRTHPDCACAAKRLARGAPAPLPGPPRTPQRRLTATDI